MQRALDAGILHLFQRREYLNRINVFPVPDGDTGSNMAFTFKAIREALSGRTSERVDQLIERVADAALDGARGNSGAIMAQYFQGWREGAVGCGLFTPESLARAASRGSEAAWSAMANPVAGTLPSVTEGFSKALEAAVAGGENDIRNLLKTGLKAAQEALERTPEQLPALRAAGVVDAGGQGFVDLLEGIWQFVVDGKVDDPPPLAEEDRPKDIEHFEVGAHRYCTECVIEGEGLNRDAVMAKLEEMGLSSIVVAGSACRLRVHVHTDAPGDVFLAAEGFGEIRQQKADDMSRQHGLLNQAGSVAVVADSGADLPQDEVDRLGIHMVPARVSFGEQEFLDGVSIDGEAFHRMLAECEELPQTSQPPPGDFARQYELLTSHGYTVVSVGLSQALSGTTGSALRAAERFEEGAVRVVDTLNATCGQGLLAIAAAEAAARGYSADEIVAMLAEMIPQTRTFGISADLSFAVRGGRLPAWVKKVTDLIRAVPLLTASPKGELVPGGVIWGRKSVAESLGKKVARKMDAQAMYRVMLAHAGNPEGANRLRRTLLKQHARIHSCHICDAGPALGVHLGPGGLIAAFMPDPEILN